MAAAGGGIPRHRRPGDHVVLREIWRNRVWYARPAIVVADRNDVRMFYVPPSVTALVPVDDAGSPLRLYADTWSLVPERRGDIGVLSFAFPDLAYAVILTVGPGATGGFYVNLQSPLAPTPLGYDTEEHILDATIAPDRSSWRWKDEDELAEAVTRGIFTPDEAATFRASGERGIRHVVERRPPFDREWDAWRPDPSWHDPVLPPDATEPA